VFPCVPATGAIGSSPKQLWVQAKTFPTLLGTVTCGIHLTILFTIT